MKGKCYQLVFAGRAGGLSCFDTLNLEEFRRQLQFASVFRGGPGRNADFGLPFASG